MIHVGAFLFGHQGHPAEQYLGNYGKIMHALGEKRAPYTVYVTGTTVRGIIDHHPLIATKIREIFAPEAGSWNPFALELGCSADQHIPLVPIRLERPYWGTHLEFARLQVIRNRDAIRQHFGINPRGDFPPENVFAPAAAQILKEAEMRYAILAGHPLMHYCGNSHVFEVEGLRLVSTAPQFGMGYWNRDIFEGSDPKGVVQAIVANAHRLGIEAVVFGFDFDLYEKIGWSVEKQISWMMAFADALYNNPETEMVNVASIADNTSSVYDLRATYRAMGKMDPHHETSCWIEDGSLDFLNEYPLSARANAMTNDVVRYYDHLEKRLGNARRQIDQWRRWPHLYEWHGNLTRRMENVRDSWFSIAGMEFRHPGWVREFWIGFDRQHNITLADLRLIDADLHRLEEAAFN